MLYGQLEYVIIDTDRYGRAIAMVYYGADRKYLSAEIIRAVMGWHYKRYSNSEELAQLEEEARAARRGLWIDDNPIPPYEWRKN